VISYWIFSGPALALALFSLRGERRRAGYASGRLSESLAGPPPATVIVPVKGYDHGLRENLAALASLDYPDYELILAARSAADIPAGVLPRRARVVLAHGADEWTSEKIQNLTAGLAAARQPSEIYAFADSDVLVSPRWLRALAAPLAEPGVGASTGYRWFAPERPGLCDLVRSVWDGVTFGLMGPGDNRFAWGGSMAIRKETFREARVAEYWRGAVSDDYRLSAAAHDAGLRIAFAPGALSPCFEHVGPRRLVAWTRRQCMITRANDRNLWRLGLLAHAIYCAGMAASLAAAAAGSRMALWVFAGQILPGMLKSFHRAGRARASMPEQAAWFRRYGWAHVLLVPFVTWFWLLALASAAFGSSIEWRGRRYSLDTPAPLR